MRKPITSTHSYSPSEEKGNKSYLCRAEKMSSVNGDHLPVLPLSILTRQRGRKEDVRPTVGLQTMQRRSIRMMLSQTKHKMGRGKAEHTHSQLLLEALDLGLQRVDVLRLPLVGHVAGVGQLRQAVQCLLQSLHVRQQLCDLEFGHDSKCYNSPGNAGDATTSTSHGAITPWCQACGSIFTLICENKTKQNNGK